MISRASGGFFPARLGYATRFQADEDPVSEGGRWRGGATHGTNWQDFLTSGGRAYGKQTGTKPTTNGYDDSCAYRLAPAGKTWGLNQDVVGKVFLTGRGGWGAGFHEVELLLRGTVSSGSNRCYEVLFGMEAGTTYCQITQWKGPKASSSGDFATSYDFLEDNNTFTAPANDTFVRATIISNVIRAYTSTDGVTWTECSDPHDITGDADPILVPGSPGMGHWKNDANAVANTYGFSYWSCITW